MIADLDRTVDLITVLNKYRRKNISTWILEWTPNVKEVDTILFKDN
jgi:hypothetical protein